MVEVTVSWTDGDENTFEVERLEWREFAVVAYSEPGDYYVWPYANLYEVHVYGPEDNGED